MMRLPMAPNSNTEGYLRMLIDDRLLTAQEAADLLGVKLSTVRKLTY